MDNQTQALRDVGLMLKLPLPAAIRLEMIGHRIDWHEAHQAEDWDAAQIHFNALLELQQLYGAQLVTDK